ncbi:MAG: MFS transporter [Aeromicrobium sp.]
MLAVGMLAQIAGTLLSNAPVFLIPFLNLERGLTLVQAGLLASTSLVGTMLTLIAWGAVVDRIGERLSLTIGLGIMTLAGLGAALSSSYVALGAFLLLVGVGAASTNSASGRLVVGWFPPERRGVAMGIRQTALPLGIGLAAFIVPVTAEAHGLRAALLVPMAVCAVATVVVVALVVDPPRPSREEAAGSGQLDNPYRGSSRLGRIHVASMLLVVPQITIWTFMLVWLIDARDWSTTSAGALVASTQLLGAGARIAVGWWSDRVGSRLGPMRIVAATTLATMLALGLLEGTGLAVALIVVATAVTVASNGLAFTAVAELGGPFWSGRAMGVHNTGQYVAASLVPPLVGGLVTGRSYAFAFGSVALFALLAIPVVPVRGERGAEAQTRS